MAGPHSRVGSRAGIGSNDSPVRHRRSSPRLLHARPRLQHLPDRRLLAHALAHPLLSPSWQLDADTFEKALLLFGTLEGTNGLADRRIEPDLATILDRLTPATIEFWKDGIDRLHDRFLYTRDGDAWRVQRLGP